MHLLNCELCGQPYYDAELVPDEQLCPACFLEVYECEEMFSKDLITEGEEEYDY